MARPTARVRAARLALLIGLCISLVSPVPAGARSDGAPQPVYNGDDAADGEFGFMTALVANGAPDEYSGQFCGGSLIKPEWVLTAAHCVDDLVPGIFHVRIGRTTLTAKGGQKRAVAEIVVHPEYEATPQFVINDVALLRLKSPSSQPRVGLASQAQRPLWHGGDKVTVIGWGRWEQNDPEYPETLQRAAVTVIGDGACGAWWLVEPDLNLCAGGYVKGACPGDSGGPLLVRASGKWKQVGVVSYGGPACGLVDDGYPPDVYGQVGSYPLKLWIQQAVQ